MNSCEPKWTIVGQGLAGTCLAWHLWHRGVDFTVVDRGLGGSSRVAAGMINPITGKNFEPSWRIGEFLPDALRFYARIEKEIGRQIWFPFPILRLASSEKEWQKIQSKLKSPDVTPWQVSPVEPPPGWIGAVELSGGGRVDTRAFLDGSRDYFQKIGRFRLGELSFDQAQPHQIWCEGASGLMAGHLGPHRCAKGEILTVHAPDWDPTHIRIGAGGWLIPQGGGNFKVGSTYEWNLLDHQPTETGRMRVTQIAKKLGGEVFETIVHEAGIRPILRRSQPLIGSFKTGVWVFNALGSKGSLYGPGIADRLANWILDQIEPEVDINLNTFLKEAQTDV